MSGDPLRWIDDELKDLSARGLRRQLGLREGPQSPPLVLHEGRPLANFGANDYLGLAADPRLAAAAARAAAEEGWGSGASPLVTGRGRWQARLEEALARFEGTEAALVFPSGFAANAGAIAALAGRPDAVYSDRKNHASIIDGCRLSGAHVEVYDHADPRHLARLLEDGNRHRRRLIVTDGLFSMDGDFAPLAELADLADRREAMLLVDEAHATGVFGAGGGGLCEERGLEHRVPIRVGTLSKALGSSGGFVAGSRALVEWLANRARPYVFSTAPPAAVCAAAVAALAIVVEEPRRRTELRSRADNFRAALAEQGWNTGRSASQIVPVVVGSPEAAVRLSAALRERGFLVPAIRPPTVPEGESLLRISLSFAHAPETIEGLSRALAELHEGV
jgi:8-amino-7-oxononanoate synthase